MVLKSAHTPALPGELVRTQTAETSPSGVSDCTGLGQGLRMCLSKKLSATADAASPGSTLRGPFCWGVHCSDAALSSWHFTEQIGSGQQGAGREASRGLQRLRGIKLLTTFVTQETLIHLEPLCLFPLLACCWGLSFIPLRFLHLDYAIVSYLNANTSGRGSM